MQYLLTFFDFLLNAINLLFLSKYMTFDIILKIIMAIGIPTIIGCAILIGRKLQCIDALEKQAEKIEKKTDKLTETVNYMKGKIETNWRESLAPSSSPMQLNDKGTKILENSGIKKIIDERKEEFYRGKSSIYVRTRIFILLALDYCFI